MNILEILIPAIRFQDFDHEKEIEVLVSTDLGLKAGDVVPWECAQFDGDAKVVSCSPGSFDGMVTCVLKKL